MALVRRVVTVVALVASTLAIAPLSNADASGGSHVTPGTGLRAGFMPMNHSGNKLAPKVATSYAPRTAPPAVNLQYFGGPLVTHAAVENVLWGASGTYLSQVALPVTTGDINTAMSDMFASQWGKNLASYSAGGYTIGAGTVTGRTSITPSVAATDQNIDGVSAPTIDDSSIQAELLSQIAAAHLGTPTANTIYTLHFPQGTRVCDAGMGATPVACSPTQGADNSNAFCGYHGATSATDPGTGLHILYVVLPYPDAFYQGGCGNHNGALSALESVASHELAETITDPQVSLATGPTAPLGWYDLNYGENGDICQGGASPAANSVESDSYQDGSGTWFSVQQIFTPQWKACVPAPPRGLRVIQTAGGRFRLAWAAPLDASQNPVHGYAIFRLTGSGWQYTAQVGGSTLSYQTGSFPLGSKQFFNILGLGQDSTDPQSEKQSNSAYATAASTPGAVPWIRTLRAGTSPTIGWAPAAANYSAVTKYVITGAGGTWAVGPTVRTFHWNSLRHGRYLITVRAVNRVGYGASRSFYLVN